MALPEFIGERCVHSLTTQALCRECIEACPRDALVLGDSTLGIDEMACDGCGLCAPACPQGAIKSLFRLTGAISIQGPLAYAGCERAELTPPTLPCLHALGVRALVELYQIGVRQLIVAAAECEGCPRRRSADVFTAARYTSEAILDRGLEPFTVAVRAPGDWQRDRDARDTSERLGQERRRFFRTILNPAVTLAADQPDAQMAVFEGLKHSRTPVLQAATPHIDVQNCTGCDACVNLCPTDAISILRDESSLAYTLDANCCTGCRICVDTCLENAIEIHTWQKAGVSMVPLEQSHCRRCGNAYHRPRITDAETCPVCEKTGHHPELFQVYED